jgi:hypothetical protein
MTVADKLSGIGGENLCLSPAALSSVRLGHIVRHRFYYGQALHYSNTWLSFNLRSECADSGNPLPAFGIPGKFIY